MRPIQLRALGELVQNDGGRAHGQGSTDHDRREPLQAEQSRDQREHQGRAPHLRRTQAEHFGTHGDHAWQGELQPQGKQQKHDAQLGQQARGLGVRYHAQRMRPQGQPHQQIAHHRRQPESADQRHHENGGGKEDQDLRERLDHRQRKLFGLGGCGPGRT